MSFRVVRGRDLIGDRRALALDTRPWGTEFLLRDDFITPRVAGAVNGTPAEPGPGIRAVIDTEGKLSIAGGELVLAKKAVAAWGNPGLVYGAIPVNAGRMLLAEVVAVGGLVGTHTGWSTSAIAPDFGNTFGLDLEATLLSNSAGVKTVASCEKDVVYKIAAIMRPGFAGSILLIKGGIYTNWTLLQADNNGHPPAVYPAIVHHSIDALRGSIRVPSQTWSPRPFASDGPINGGTVFTFDDGWETVYTVAYPAMKARGIKGTIYVTSSWIDTPGKLTSAQLLEMYADGWDMGIHGVDHTAWTVLTQAQVEAEIAGCRAFLAGLGTTRGNLHAAYPSGAHDATTDAAMAAQGMLTGTTIANTPIPLPIVNPDYALGRRVYTQAEVLLNLETDLVTAQRIGNHIILAAHGISGAAIDAEPGLFMDLLNHVCAKGYRTYTITEANALAATEPLAITNGRGHIEGGWTGASGYVGIPTIGEGGGNLPWAQEVGSWVKAAAKANCNALAGGLGIATVVTPTADVLAMVDLTRAAGAAGLVLRYTDAQNYIYAYHDGVNAALIQRVAGVESNVIAPTAKAYVAGASIVVALYGTKARLFYNNAAVGGEGTTAVVAGMKHGLWTNNIDPTLDNFVVYARGTGGEHGYLDSFI